MKFSDFPIRGVDVSTYDGAVKWDVLNPQVSFAVIRAGHGRKIDTQFKANWAGCKVAKHAYWYMDYYSNHDPDSTAYGISDVEWGLIQAQNCYNFMGGSAMVWLDIETYSGAANSVFEVWARVELIARTFLEKIDELNGLTNGIYCSASVTKNFSAWFKDRPLWVAWYNRLLTIEKVKTYCAANGWTGRVWFWQYASDADTDGDGSGDGKSLGLGRDKEGDLDVWLGTVDEWKQAIGGNKNMLLTIPPLWQRDPRWKDYQLGTSNKTIGSHGCVITDVTMFLRYLGIDITPDQLNIWLKANDGYNNTNWFVWAILNKLDKRISFAYRYEYAALDKIDAQLAKGLPVIVNVDMVPGTPVMDEHWVLVVGKVNGSYIINDPWYGEQFRFEEKYGSPSKGIYIVSTYKFTGTPAPLPPDEPEPLPEGKARTLVNLNIRKGAGTSYARWATAPKGTLLDVLEIKGDWVRCGWNQWALSQLNGVRYLE